MPVPQKLDACPTKGFLSGVRDLCLHLSHEERFLMEVYGKELVNECKLLLFLRLLAIPN